MKVSCNKGWGNKSKEKGDELAGSLKQAESKFAYVTIALSTLIPNVPSWFSRQKALRCGEGPEGDAAWGRSKHKTSNVHSVMPVM